MCTKYRKIYTNLVYGSIKYKLKRDNEIYGLQPPKPFNQELKIKSGHLNQTQQYELSFSFLVKFFDQVYDGQASVKQSI